MSNITNLELADIFDKIGNLLEIKGEVIYKTLAYRRAADSLRANAAEASTLDTQDRLQEIPGVGKAIAEKIHEILTTGKLDFLVRLENEVPPSLVDLPQGCRFAQRCPQRFEKCTQDPPDIKQDGRMVKCWLYQ